MVSAFRELVIQWGRQKYSGSQKYGPWTLVVPESFPGGPETQAIFKNDANALSLSLGWHLHWDKTAEALAQIKEVLVVVVSPPLFIGSKKITI